MSRDTSALLETGLSVLHSTINGPQMADLAVEDIMDLELTEVRRLVGIMGTLVELALSCGSVTELDRAVELLVSVERRS